ncbi:hypothetical protein [Ahrensia kielensis]|uniref:hypothetical protein n=1 Tax=Ahrensia kielensis TaxID=76980 RepID=UPI0003627D2E|nr:hypothetical protein [Ahrensia kielensis]
MKRAIILTGLLVVSGCGTTAQNADVNQGLALKANAVAEVSNVQVFETGPAGTSWRNEVKGVSCKNKLYDPAPSEANALNLMKKQAAERGFNAVHSVTVNNLGAAAVAINCWSALEAKGVAFNSP